MQFHIRNIVKPVGNVLKDIRFYIILAMTISSVVRKSLNLQQFFINLGKNIRLVLARPATIRFMQGRKET